MAKTQEKTEYNFFRSCNERCLDNKLIDEAKEFFNFLFVGMDSKLYINVSNMEVEKGEVKVKVSNYYNLQGLLLDLSYIVGQRNMFFTYNSMRRFSRAKVNVGRINCLAFDIDFKEQKLNHLEILDILKNKFPIKPSFVINSGNGYHVYYGLEAYHNANTVKTEFYYNLLYDTVKESLLKWSIVVDGQAYAPLNRFLRIPNNINDKPDRGKQKVKIIYKDLNNRYRTEHIREALGDVFNVLYDERSKRKIVQFKPKDILKANKTVKGISSNLFWDRKKDLLAYLDNRFWDISKKGNKKGLRNRFTFIYLLNELSLDKSRGALKSDDEYIEIMLDLNSKFLKGRDEKELKANVKEILKNFRDGKGAYRQIKNETIIRDLGITQEERKDFLSLIGKDVRAERKKERDKKYYQEHKEEKQEYNKKYYIEKVKVDSVIEKEKKKYNKLIKKYENSSKNIREKNKKKAIQELRVSGKYTIHEIADICSLSVNTIRKTLKEVED